VHQNFPAEASAVAAARSFASRAVTRLACPECADDALLVVSELVTNAIRAGARRVGVDISRESKELRIRVTDDGVGWPRMHRPGPNTAHGRGLVLVAAVATDWGVEPREAGKEVWAALSVA
jgi:anti-sigma regulatory factor (Ser/Thr protein kinase)